jgi:hypothetical protein
MPEMLPADYEEALHYFTLWERQAAGLPDQTPGFPAGLQQHLWYGHEMVSGLKPPF